MSTSVLGTTLFNPSRIPALRFEDIEAGQGTTIYRYSILHISYRHQQAYDLVMFSLLEQGWVSLLK